MLVPAYAVARMNLRAANQGMVLVVGPCNQASTNDALCITDKMSNCQLADEITQIFVLHNFMPSDKEQNVRMLP